MGAGLWLALLMRTMILGNTPPTGTGLAAKARATEEMPGLRYH